MHTNLILTVKVTEDCRFAFAGCLKGSMEMLAVDMGQIPMWRQSSLSSDDSSVGRRTTRDNDAGLRSASHAPARVRTFNHLDPKLRGFGAVSRLRPLRDKSSAGDEKYVLICGKGIKSVHVWLFTPATDSTSAPTPISALPTTKEGAQSSNTDTAGGPVWTFLFDVATNGVTIEALGFRFWVPPPMTGCENQPALLSDTDVIKKGESPANGQMKSEQDQTFSSSSSPSTPVPEPMLQMISKSRGMCVRVWNLIDLDRDMSEENESDLGKLPYEDIPNSHDSRAFSDDGELSFGGTYNFSVLRLDAPKWANRESYEVPARCTEDDSGQRRRRLMREINEVIACHDGNHVLALCTDGGVLYYHYDGCSSNESRRFGSLIEFQSLTREVEVGPEFMTDDSWAIKRVGTNGSVVVIRACKGLASKDEEGGGAIVDISLLHDLAPESVISVPENDLREESNDFLPRNQGLCYHDDSQCRDVDTVAPLMLETVVSSSSSSGKPPSGRPRKRKDKEVEKSAKSGDNKLQSSTPREKKVKLSSASTPTGKFTTPSEAVRGIVKQGSSGKRQNNLTNISPQDNVQSHGSESGDDNNISKRLYAPTPNAKKKKHDDNVVSSSEETSTQRKERKSGRKRPLVLQVKYGGDDDESGAVDDVADDTLLSHSTCESAFESPVMPLTLPHPGPPPKVNRVKVVPYSTSLVGTKSTSSTSEIPVHVNTHPMLVTFQNMKDLSWTPLTTSAFVAGIHLCDSTFLTMLGPNSRQTAETLLLEQDRLYQLFLIEFLRGLETVIRQHIVSVARSVETDIDIAISSCKEFWASFLLKYKSIVIDIMKDQKMQMMCAMSKDRLLSEKPEELTSQHHVSVGRVGLPPLPSPSDVVSTTAAHVGIADDHSVGEKLPHRGELSKQWSFVHCRMYIVAEGIIDSFEKMIRD